jgi:oligoribonuclease NrnB/cAMP/cGMP phosphodiesterase (DHH superfamily)
MCDISFPFSETSKLIKRLGFNYIWIDHHISAIKENECLMISNNIIKVPMKMNGLRDANYAACELAWKFFFPNEEMPEIVRLLGRYDCFGHKGTKEERAVLEFQYGARSLIFNYEDAYNALNDSIQYHKLNHSLEFTSPEEDIIIEGEHIYKYLCNEAKQTYENRFEIKLEEPEVFTSEFGSTNTVIRKFLCINQERFNPINFGIDYHKDGYDGFACFWYKDGKWIFSLYNDNGLVDCSKIAKQYNGGGHKGAAGFIIDNINDLNKMIRENN